MSARIQALLDEGKLESLPGRDQDSSAVVVGAGKLNGIIVWVAASDASRARGAIGIQEAAALRALFRAARAAPAPLLLCLDSAGANVEEGLAALGAFRRLFEDALQVRLAGIPMVALLGRACFGGASLIASLCHARVYSEQTLLAVSGPRVIEALGGDSGLDASDRDAVRQLMGGRARAQHHKTDVVAADALDAFRAAATEIIQRQPSTQFDLERRHRDLRSRIRDLPSDLAAPAATQTLPVRRLVQLLPSGYAGSGKGAVVTATSTAEGLKPVFAGVLGGDAVGAAECWLLCEELLKLHARDPACPMVLLLDATGHAATRRDEEIMLSDYLVHLSLTAAWLASRGHNIVLWIPGAAAGAVYVAFASPCSSVSALPSARIRILPAAAMEQIVGFASSGDGDSLSLLKAEVIDAQLDARLNGYADVRDSGQQ